MRCDSTTVFAGPPLTPGSTTFRFCQFEFVPLSPATVCLKIENLLLLISAMVGLSARYACCSSIRKGIVTTCTQKPSSRNGGADTYAGSK